MHLYALKIYRLNKLAIIKNVCNKQENIFFNFFLIKCNLNVILKNKCIKYWLINNNQIKKYSVIR